jgi:hypothetical protein
LEKIISIKDIIYIILIFILIYSIYLISYKKINFNKLKYFYTGFHITYFITLILTFIFLTIYPQYISNPITNSIHDISEEIKGNYFTIKLNPKTIIKNINNTNFKENTNYNNQLKNYSKYKIKKNQIILIFVLEQTPYQTFNNDLKKIPKDENFIQKIKNNSLFYTNYYTNNQDSRTAIWTMLSSQFIPFECYYDDWNKKYGSVLENRNLVDLFNYNNYTTIAVSSQDKFGLLLSAYNWKKKIHLKNYSLITKKYICQDDIEYAKGCEDLAILNQTINTILKYKKNIFLLQEMIYGHSPKYQKMKNLTPTEYYNNYFLKIYSVLKKHNLTENLTFVIVSDHGDKDIIKKKLNQYQIPLIIYNKNLSHKTNTSLYSHINFKNILLENLLQNPKILKTQTRPVEKLIMGQTLSNELLYINENNDYFLAKRENELKFKIYETNMNKTSITQILYNYSIYKQKIENYNKENNFYCKYCQ